MAKRTRGCMWCGSSCGVPGCQVCEGEQLCHKCQSASGMPFPIGHPERPTPPGSQKG